MAVKHAGGNNQTDESNTPEQIYHNKKEKHLQNITHLEASCQHVTRSRIVSVLVIILVAWLAFTKEAISPYWLIAPTILFCVLVIWHSRLKRKLQHHQRAVEYYTKGVDRIAGNWIGQGQNGSNYCDPDHPYTEDLDIFGEGSLFELMCAAPTQLGKDTLANWLSLGSNTEEILKRQESVAELRQELVFIENIALLETDSHDEFNRERLKNFLHFDFPVIDSIKLAAALILGLSGIIALTLWLSNNGATPLVVVLLVAIVFYRVFFSNIFKIANAVDEACSGLATVAQAMKLVEDKRFQTPLLQEWHSSLFTQDHNPSWQINKLYKHSQALNNCLRNQVAVPVSLLLGLPVFILYQIGAWRTSVGSQVEKWFEILGQFEAMISIARYSFEHPNDVFPHLADDNSQQQFVAQHLGHPLLPSKQCVANDVCLDKNHRLIIVSGSNMSGKSTFLRSIGINTVLALCGAPVRAKSLTLSHFTIGTAMRVSDSLQQGVSHFYAEISRLKAVLSLADKETPLLFLLDEILHGTNSHDRLAGAEWIVQQLIKQNTFGLVTTHDLSLTAIADRHSNIARNMHFRDSISDGKMLFDYKIKSGVVEKGNAIELMKSIGLDIDS